MLADKLPITGPCPIDLDAIGFDRSSKVSHCSHCAKNVTVLSNMTKREAQEFLREHKGQKLCVSYAHDEDGRIRFRPEPTPAPEPALVPVARLRPRTAAARAAGFAAALGVGAALAACAPHGEPPRETTVVRIADGGMTVPHHSVLDEPPKPLPQVPQDPQEIMVDGEMAVPDPAKLDEPCDKAEPTPRKRIVERTKKSPPPEPIHAAGGMMIPETIEGEMAVPDPDGLDARR